MKQTICVATGSRAEYGLLYWLLKELEKDSGVNLQLLVTGTHLSSKFGFTRNQIVQDGFSITAEVDANILSDEPRAVCASMATILKGSAQNLAELKPDAVIILGDRYEMLSVAQACLMLNIPLVHIHGGEITEGAVDDSIRHAITKLSRLHFTSTEEYRQRVIQLGEAPQTVFNLGAPGLENIRKLKLMSKHELAENLQIKFGPKNILMTFHPVTVNKKISETETRELLKTLEKLDEKIHLYITMPNADTYSEAIRSGLETLGRKRSNIFIYENLGQVRYLSLASHMDLVLGNSSSGIIEIPFLKVPVINIGIRQQGRLSDKLVTHVKAQHKLILAEIKRTLKKKSVSKGKKYLYGDGIFAAKAKKIILKEVKNLPKYKKFYDL